MPLPFALLGLNYVINRFVSRNRNSISFILHHFSKKHHAGADPTSSARQADIFPLYEWCKELLLGIEPRLLLLTSASCLRLKLRFKLMSFAKQNITYSLGERSTEPTTETESATS